MARWHLAGVAVLCLVVLPWGIPFLQQSGITWQDFSKEGLHRFGDKTSHSEVWYWYLLQMPGWFMPWFLLLPLALWQTWRRSADERSPLRRLCWAWLGWGVLLLSALAAKQRHYAIPLFPPLAMLLGDAVARWLAHCEPPRRRLAHLALGALGGLMALAALGAPLLAARAGMVAPGDERVVWFSAASAALFFLIGAAVVLRRDRGFSLWWAAFICAVVVFALTKEKQEAAEGPEDFCRQVREKVPPAAVLYDYDAVLPRRAEARKAVWRAQVLFYLQRRVTVSDKELAELLGDRGETYALVTQKHLDAAPPDRYEVLARVPRFLDHSYSVVLIKGKGAGTE
jgi:4-amino-4-deoxy-L-arabinose transferase-like glycosyltransferase